MTSRSGWLFAAASVALLVWLNAGELPLAARAWTAVLLAVLPPLTIAQALQLRSMEALPRVPAYASSIVSLWLLAAISAAAAAGSGFTAAQLGGVMLPLLPTVAWTAGLTAAGVAVLFLFRFAGFREAPVLRELLPVSGPERSMFVALSATAGICEEIVFRGFLIHALTLATGSVTLALLLSSCVFGVVHAYQSPLGAVRAALLGALLALPLVFHGSIVPAILAHTLIDILSGLWLARWLLR